MSSLLAFCMSLMVALSVSLVAHADDDKSATGAPAVSAAPALPAADADTSKHEVGPENVGAKATAADTAKAPAAAKPLTAADQKKLLDRATKSKDKEIAKFVQATDAKKRDDKFWKELGKRLDEFDKQAKLAHTVPPAPPRTGTATMPVKTPTPPPGARPPAFPSAAVRPAPPAPAAVVRTNERPLEATPPVTCPCQLTSQPAAPVNTTAISQVVDASHASTYVPSSNVVRAVDPVATSNTFAPRTTPFFSQFPNQFGAQSPFMYGQQPQLFPPQPLFMNRPAFQNYQQPQFGFNQQPGLYGRPGAPAFAAFQPPQSGFPTLGYGGSTPFATSPTFNSALPWGGMAPPQQSYTIGGQAPAYTSYGSAAPFYSGQPTTAWSPGYNSTIYNSYGQQAPRYTAYQYHL